MAVFGVDEDMRPLIASGGEKRKYDKLLDLWVKGLTFDWDTLYTRAPRRVGRSWTLWVAKFCFRPLKLISIRTSMLVSS